MNTMRMFYRQYKQHYSDCETVPGSYDSINKSIEVIVPEGRMKPSGVRGRHFHGYQLWFKDASGDCKYCTYRAVSLDNAMKQHIRTCKEEGWTPCEPPQGREARIFM